MSWEPPISKDAKASGFDSRLRVKSPADFLGFRREDVKKPVAEVFESVALRFPESIALKREGRTLSYAALNQAANRVAHAILAAKPFKPLSISPHDPDALSHWEENGEPVAVYMEQGIGAVIAALALMKAGKIFVPMDPDDPHTRNQSILDISAARLLVTNDKYFAESQKLVPQECQLLNVDGLENRGALENPALPIGPRDPALLVFTSGSTGQPKGVIHTQRNLLHDVMEKTSVMGISPSDRLSLLAWGTGQAVKTIFSALLNGATLLPFNLKRQGLTHLARWMMNEKISVHTVSAPISRSFLELLRGDETFPHLRIIRTASDTVYATDISQMKKHFGPDCFFVNALSSNETGTLCAHVMNHSSVIDSTSVPIGYPVEDFEISLLNESEEAVNGRKVGALSIKSRYIARGYWRNPVKTREAFSIDPDDPEVITFKSADLAYFRPDGMLQLCGRKDFMVKIRGYRVETTEVEAALLQHPGVAAAVVHPHESHTGEKRLVAYLVAKQRPAPSTTALHHFLRERLTDYMIPATFVILDKIPLLPNGKTNRRTLPPPGRHRPTLDNEYVAPSNGTETRLVEIWSQVTGIDQVGVHDPFLELGGDSLKAGQVMARILETFGVDLPLRWLFESSTVAEIASVIERQPGQAGDTSTPSIERRPGQGPWELSFGQKRLWFIDQLQPGNLAYNMPKLIRLTGHLHVSALEEALESILNRHEVLRTNYRLRNGEPEAEVADHSLGRLPVVDLTHYADSLCEGELHRLIDEASQRPFDLARDTMLRCTLYRVKPDEHVLLCVTHHIASDGWSRGILMKELVTHYEAFVAGEPSPVEPLPIQYSDFARWQIQRQSTPEIQSQLDYWSAKLEGLPSSLDLPLDRPRPAEASSRGAAHFFIIPPGQTKKLEALARQEHVTLYMLMLAAFNTLLFRYTGQEDIVVGSPVAGRSLVETENLIGFFVNSLVMRNDLSGNPGFRELLGRVRTRALAAYAHAGVPFEKLVEHLKPDRSFSGNPLFQIVFDVHRPRSQVRETGGLTFAWMASKRQTAPFDQGWNIAITDQGMRARVEYDTDLFDAATIERMGDHFQTLLSGILQDPATPIATLPLLTAAERQQMLVDWNNTHTDYPRHQTIDQLFEAQAARLPDKVAVVYHNESLTYRELETRANQLANHLRQLNVGAEVPVAVLMNRSVDMIVAFLAVLKAGGAYVPMDPDYPEKRLAFMLADTRAPVLLSKQGLAAMPVSGATVVCLDRDRDAISRNSERPPAKEAGPENLAYIIYTSGSTGQPKGVGIEHTAVAALVRETNYIDLTEDDVVGQAANATFDAATFEIWGALLNGCKLVGLEKDDILTPRGLARELKENNITTLFLTTTLFNIAARTTPDAFAGMRQLLVGGEALDPYWVKVVLDAGKPQRFLNSYGPTETTTFASWFEVEAGARNIPIGKPLANMALYVLDAHLQPVPIGVAGELWVGGTGLARGYWNRPELTEKAFLQHAEYGRIYRTGDLCRRLADGNVEFLGRIDHQLKIRGFRIEPGEIETALARHPDIGQSVVMGLEEAPDASQHTQGTGRQLVAYVMAKTPDRSSLAVDKLRGFLKTALPGYMIPSVFVLLDTLPLTPNGKVDRNALPAPDKVRATEAKTMEQAGSPVEKKLAALWSGILKLDEVGVHDDFFTLGGHSLMAIRLMDRVKTVFNVQLTVRELFDTPTVAALATLIERKSGNGGVPQ